MQYVIVALYEIYPHFTYIFLYFAHLRIFLGTQGQNMNIWYQKNYFKLFQSTLTMDLCNYRLLTVLFSE